ncbi:MAG: MarR family transcriptional regulator [Rhodobacteraceae bacterium]|nr:MarR family transcriptional regulator [Paracoccaceae bacterium]
MAMTLNNEPPAALVNPDEIGPVPTGDGGLPEGLPPFDLDRHLPQLINMTMAEVNGRLDAALRAIDLPLAHWRLLAIVRSRPGCTLSDVASLTVIDMSTLSRAIRRLEEDKLVRRRSSRADGRRMSLHLTSHGEGVFAEAWSVVSRYYAFLFAGLTEEDEAALRRIMHELRDRLDRSPWDSL